MIDKRRIISLIIFVLSIGLILYPVISSFLNNYKQAYTINEYQTIVEEKADYTEEKKQCIKYNQSLINNPARFQPDEEGIEEYNNLLNIADGLMGFVDIPKINIKLPIYHHSEIKELSNGTGHVLGTSLPVGGKGTHAVIAGHTGMASQMMFTDLTDLEIGDKFYIRVLDEIITYEIDQIELVLPEDTSLIGINPDEDYVTLVTCYPLGIGSHRLLVRGHNVGIETEQAKEQIISSPKVMTKTDKIYLFLLIGAIVAIICYILVFFKVLKKKEDKNI